MKTTMRDELFQELLESVKQGADIMKGESHSSRTFEFPETEVHALHELEGLRLMTRGEKEIEAGVGFDLKSVLAEADALLANP